MAFVLEQPYHADAVEALLDQAFGAGRKDKTVYRLRDGVPPLASLCFVCESNDGRIDASIRYWPIGIAGTVPALLLGPIAVAASRQGEGLGVRLIKHSLTVAAANGHRIVLLVGDERYYGRFGFRRALASRLQLPGSVDLHRFLAAELVTDALDGVAGQVGPAPTQTIVNRTGTVADLSLPFPSTSLWTRSAAISA